MMFYNIFLLLRVWLHHSRLAVTLEDTLFWVLATAAIFALLFLQNEGALRFYALQSIGLGMWLSYRLIGKKCVAAAKRVLHKP